MVFCRCTNHGRPTDIDIFYRIVKRTIGFSDRLLKWVQVHHYQINGGNTVFLHYVCIDLPATEYAAVDFWMQCFHTATHNFGKPGDRRYLGDIHTIGRKLPCGTTGG